MTKIRVVWANGTEQYFSGNFRFHSHDLWIVEQSSNPVLPVFIPAGQVRYIEVVEE